MDMRHLFAFLVMLLFCVASSAQQLVFGSVRDGFLKVPLVNARVTLLTADSVVVQDSIKVVLNKRDGERWGRASFSIMLPKKTCTYLLHATLDGYEDDWQTISVEASVDDAIGLDRPLELRRVREKVLGEATVSATRLKMFYKGDTLVYDASAFKLPDGSMLDDLIRQMPGVKMNDNGEIFVNNRKVDEVLLGARSFMGGNSKVLLENLPYYTVKNVKVYEKETDRSRAVGYEVERKQYVMDVNLKDAYRNGYIGNVESAGGSNERWLGRGFLMGYTDKLRFTLLANANNVNEKRHIGETSSWKPENMPLSMLTTKSVAGEVDYQSKGGKLKENFMFDFMSSTDKGETMQRRELFLDGSMPYSSFRSLNTSKSNRLLVKNRFSLTLPQKVHADLSVEFVYNKYKGNSESLSEDFLDSINTRLRSSSYNDGHSLRINAGGFIASRVNNKFFRSLSAFYGFKHEEDKNETARGYMTEQFATPSTTRQFNANDFRHRETLGNLHLLWANKIGKNLQLEVQDRQEYYKTHDRDHLFHPDTIMLPSQLDALLAISDPRNSYVSDYGCYSNTPTFSLKWRKYIPGPYMKMEYLYWALAVPVDVMAERLDYTRNNTEQNKKRTAFSLYPSFTFKMLPTKKAGEQLQLQLMYEQSAPSIFELLDYVDDAVPQIVKLGNPNLKGNASTAFNVSFTDRESKRRQQYDLKGNFRYHHRQIAQSVVFNPANSQYTYQPANVHGAYDITAQFSYVRSQFGKQNRWSWQTTLDAAHNHSVDHAMQTGMTESAPNAVNTYSLRDALSLTYQYQDFTAKAVGEVHWRHSEGKMQDFVTLNAFNYQYGLMARYTLPVVKTTFSADANIYSRRGYGSKVLNTDDFVVNFSVSQPFLKGRLIAGVKAFDLFHQLSSTQYAINAQGRTEIWNRTLPNYVMLHLVYHFSRQPKK